MKGVVLSFPNREKRQAKRRCYSFPEFFSRYMSTIVLTVFFTAGIIFGAIAALRGDSGFIEDMDFLFTTNLNSRLSLGLLSGFAAHFASNFIFFTLALLCGLSPWGVGVLPFVTAFKGFGAGLSAAYLFSVYGLKGFGFYLVVVLPGTFVFSLCLIFMCSSCISMSRRIAKCLFTAVEGSVSIYKYVRSYLQRCVSFLLLAALGAICDMLLWSFVSKLFF